VNGSQNFGKEAYEVQGATLGTVDVDPRVQIEMHLRRPEGAVGSHWGNAP